MFMVFAAIVFIAALAYALVGPHRSGRSRRGAHDAGWGTPVIGGDAGHHSDGGGADAGADGGAGGCGGGSSCGGGGCGGGGS